jgi:hypothetical protein
MIISRWMARTSIPDPPPRLTTKKLKNTYRAEIKPFLEKAKINNSNRQYTVQLYFIHATRNN